MYVCLQDSGLEVEDRMEVDDEVILPKIEPVVALETKSKSKWVVQTILLIIYIRHWEVNSLKLTKQRILLACCFKFTSLNFAFAVIKHKLVQMWWQLQDFVIGHQSQWYIRGLNIGVGSLYRPPKSMICQRLEYRCWKSL